MDLPTLTQASPKGSTATALAAERGGSETFRELVGQIGRELAEPMTSALQRLDVFAASGRIDRAGLRALGDEIARARRIALNAQQISRFASGRVRQRPQRLDLPQALRGALAQRSGETAVRGIHLRQELKPAEIVIDASMAAALLQALLDWSFEHARSHIEFRIDVKSWPEHARLACRFDFIPADELPTRDTPDAAPLDTVPWHLLRRLAQSLGVLLQRVDEGGRTQLTLEFPRTVGATLALLDLDPPSGDAPAAPSMLGRHVLVIASRRETRHAVRDTLRACGLVVDYAASVHEARQFCDDGLPHAILFEAALAGETFGQLRAEWSRKQPTLAFIEITEQGREFEVRDLGGRHTSRIGRDAIASALPGALMFELAQAG